MNSRLKSFQGRANLLKKDIKIMTNNNLEKNPNLIPCRLSGKISPEKEGAITENVLSICKTLSSERYQAFIENINVGVYELDIHGNFLYFNNSLCNIFSYPREEIQFQHFSKFMTEEDSKMVGDAFKFMYETKKNISDLIWKIKDKHGDLRIIQLSANLIHNKMGDTIGYRGIAIDITDQYNAQIALIKSEKRYRTFLDFIPYPIIVFTTEGLVSYLNPAFTEVFGWNFDEVFEKEIHFIPKSLKQENRETTKQFCKEKIIFRYETQRLTIDGRLLDVVMQSIAYLETDGTPPGELVILRDITKEKRIARNNEAMMRISMALPEYLDLEELLDFISAEVRRLLKTLGALVIMLDEEKEELFVLGASYVDPVIQEKVKRFRFPIKNLHGGHVIETGEPLIIPDTSKDPEFYRERDKALGYKTENILEVPLRSSDRTIGVLCAINKTQRGFDETDIELLNMIAGTVAISIENARFSEELKKAYKEVTSLNRAKDKVINHLSHELKTPLSVLSASLNTLKKRLHSQPKEVWGPTMDRAERNLERVLEIQYQVEDIIKCRHNDVHYLVSWLLDQCADALTSLVAEEVGEGSVVKRVKDRIDEIFGYKDSIPKEIYLDQIVADRMRILEPSYSHRHVNIIKRLDSSCSKCIPLDPLQKVIDGLIKNAIENTPDEGKIEIIVQKKWQGTEVIVKDYGVGITEENQRLLFEGFISTQDTLSYSSKRPYDFNAGGKGADLLRIKIFSDRFNFRIGFKSSRCSFLPESSDVCPGKISDCSFCKCKEDCYSSGGTSFILFFPIDKISDGCIPQT